MKVEKYIILLNKNNIHTNFHSPCIINAENVNARGVKYVFKYLLFIVDVRCCFAYTYLFNMQFSDRCAYNHAMPEIKMIFAIQIQIMQFKCGFTKQKYLCTFSKRM